MLNALNMNELTASLEELADGETVKDVKDVKDLDDGKDENDGEKEDKYEDLLNVKATEGKSHFKFPNELYLPIAKYLMPWDTYKLMRMSKAVRKFGFPINFIPELDLEEFNAALSRLIMGGPNLLFVPTNSLLLRVNLSYLKKVPFILHVTRWDNVHPRDIITSVKRSLHCFGKVDSFSALLSKLTGLPFSTLVKKVYNEKLDGFDLISLQLAAFVGCTEAVEMYFSKGPFSSIVDDLERVVHYGIISGSIPLVLFLLKETVTNPILHSSSATQTLGHFSTPEMMQSLLQEDNFHPDAEDNYLVAMTAMRGNIECLKLLLLDPRVDAGANRNKALVDTIDRGDDFAEPDVVDAVLLLLINNRRVDPSANDNKAHRIASRKRDGRMAEMLLKDPRVSLKIAKSTPTPLRHAFNIWNR